MKYFEFGRENPELIVMLHGGGVSYIGALPAAKGMAKEHDALTAYLKTYSNRTIRNIFWSANNYALPQEPAETGCHMIYWYGDDEKKARRANIRFIKKYFPHARARGIPKMDHAELVMIHPQEFYRRATGFLHKGIDYAEE